MCIRDSGRTGLRRAGKEVIATGGFMPFEQLLQQSGVLRRAQLQGGQPGGPFRRRQVQRFVQQGAQAGPGGSIGGCLLYTSRCV